MTVLSIKLPQKYSELKTSMNREQIAITEIKNQENRYVDILLKAVADNEFRHDTLHKLFNREAFNAK